MELPALHRKISANELVEASINTAFLNHFDSSHKYVEFNHHHSDDGSYSNLLQRYEELATEHLKLKRKYENVINDLHYNPKLKYVIYNNNVKSTNNINNLRDVDYIFIALPSQNIREVVKQLKDFNKDQKIIIASKGIEIDTKLFLHEVINSETNNKNICILSGPCFSNEVAQNLPTAVTLASEDRELFEEVILLFKN